MRDWNPLWGALWDGQEAITSGYADAIKRSVLASVNWIETHLGANLEWHERNIQEIMELVGAPDDVDPKVGLMGFWSDFMKPTTDDAKDWMATITKACENGQGEDAGPTITMMQKAMACGLMVRDKGWDAFDMEMLTLHNDTALKI